MKQIQRSLALLVGIAIVGASHFAAADTAKVGPNIAFAQQNNAQVQAPANGLAAVSVNFSDTADLRSAKLSGPNRSAVFTFSPGIHSASAQLYWSTQNIPAGDYTFNASLVDANGAQMQKTMTLHLVK